jgi:hypothetical protein
MNSAVSSSDLNAVNVEGTGSLVKTVRGKGKGVP